MADAKAKTINLLLYEGDLEGVISIEDSSWNSGELYSAPRDSVSELLETDACKKYGVYLLLSKSMVYVGQSSDLSKRITQHTVGKDWWESVVILTTKDDSLTHSDIDYLESVLIDKAWKWASRKPHRSAIALKRFCIVRGSTYLFLFPVSTYPFFTVCCISFSRSVPAIGISLMEHWLFGSAIRIAVFFSPSDV